MSGDSLERTGVANQHFRAVMAAAAAEDQRNRLDRAQAKREKPKRPERVDDEVLDLDDAA